MHFSQLSNSHLSKGEAESGAKIGESRQMESAYRGLFEASNVEIAFNVEMVGTKHGMVWVNFLAFNGVTPNP